MLDTSGHTPGGVSFYCPEAHVVLTGDALFAGSIGRCDIPGGAGPQDEQYRTSHLRSPPDRVIHGIDPGQRTNIKLLTAPCFEDEINDEGRENNHADENRNLAGVKLIVFGLSGAMKRPLWSDDAAEDKSFKMLVDLDNKFSCWRNYQGIYICLT